MAKIDVLNIDGQKVDQIELKDEIFAITPHKQAMFDAILHQRASLRQGTHAVKNRAAVSGGGKKPWKQKGTGRARQGSIRSPQWRGGGVVFGPSPRSYSTRINKKVSRLALISSLATKFQNDKLIVLNDLKIEQPKTKVMVGILQKLGVERKPLIITTDYVENVFLSTRNIQGALNLDVAGINILDVTNAHSLVITQDAVKAIQEVYNGK